MSVKRCSDESQATESEREFCGHVPKTGFHTVKVEAECWSAQHLYYIQKCKAASGMFFPSVKLWKGAKWVSWSLVWKKLKTYIIGKKYSSAVTHEWKIHHSTSGCNTKFIWILIYFTVGACSQTSRVCRWTVFKYKDSLPSDAVVSMAIEYKYSTVLPVCGCWDCEVETCWFCKQVEWQRQRNDWKRTCFVKMCSWSVG